MKIYDEGMFLSHLDIEIAKSERYSYPFSVIMVEIVDFKKSNVTLIQSIIETDYRASDIVSMFDKKTYVILLNGTDEDGAKNYLKRLIKKLVADKGVSLKVGIREFVKDDTRKTIIESLNKQINKSKEN
jgi:PleD family two-component response regulator